MSESQYLVTPMRGKRALVLGAGGFIGKELCRRLIGLGASVACFDRASPQDASAAIASHDLEWIVGDFSDGQLIRRAVSGADYVFHLISTTIPETSDKDLSQDLSSNVLSTLQLLDAVKGMDLKKFVFVSSGGTVYGVPRSIPMSEFHATDPICGYGIHKLTIEKYLHWHRHNHGLDYCVLRLSNPYGPSQVSDRPQGAIGRFVYKALRGEIIEIWGDGSVVRDYINIRDVIDAFLLSTEYRGKESVFNVGSGSGHSLSEVASTIGRHLGRPLDIRYLPGRAVDVPLNILDIARIRSEFGWNPTTDLVTGIEEMIRSA